MTAYRYYDTISIDIAIEQDSPEEAKRAWKNVVRRIGSCADFCDNIFEADIDADEFDPDRIQEVDAGRPGETGRGDKAGPEGP